MKDKLWIAAGLVAAMGLAACEARVTTTNSGETNGIIIRTDNAAAAIQNGARSAGNAMSRAGDAFENGFNTTVNEIRSIGDERETGRDGNLHNSTGNRH